MIRISELATLALDSYNEGIIIPENAGNYILVFESDLELGGEAVQNGFYAAAYNKIGTNEIVISYRGTDSLFGAEQ